MKKNIAVVILISSLTLLGCATTGKNTQADMDAMNARISALQSQLGEKDQELSKLQAQLSGQESSLSQLEAEKRTLSDRLDQALSDLKSAKSKAAKKVAVADDSDLK